MVLQSPFTFQVPGFPVVSSPTRNRELSLSMDNSCRYCYEPVQYDFSMCKCKGYLCRECFTQEIAMTLSRYVGFALRYRVWVKQDSVFQRLLATVDAKTYL